MSRSASAKVDRSGWWADVVERLDRRSMGVASAFVAVSLALKLAGPGDATAVVLHTVFKFSTVMMTLAVLAVALVAVARGHSVWVAYPAAGLAVLAIGSALGVVFDPYGWLAITPPPSFHTMVVAHLYSLSILLPFAVLYVYASNATHDEKVLRAVEAQRVAEGERLAQQRLQIELATVDHDLVLTAMRLALTAPERAAWQAEGLLEAVTAYLRVAQQRGSSEPGRIAAALAELRQTCATRGGEPAQHAIA
jgi:hypothetical protein